MYKLLHYSFIAIFALGCNSNTSNNNASSDTIPVADTINTVPVVPAQDTVAAKEQEQPADTPAGNNLPDISGTHNLTLQWISWDRPGKAQIKKTGENTYTIKGSQTGNNQKLEIDGNLKMITPLELEFDGTIITKSTISNVEPCVKKGKQTFLSTKGRKYWRLQNMASCTGGGVVDYIDIYF